MTSFWASLYWWTGNCSAWLALLKYVSDKTSVFVCNKVDTFEVFLGVLQNFQGHLLTCDIGDINSSPFSPTPLKWGTQGETVCSFRSSVTVILLQEDTSLFLYPSPCKMNLPFLASSWLSSLGSFVHEPSYCTWAFEWNMRNIFEEIFSFFKQHWIFQPRWM